MALALPLGIASADDIAGEQASISQTSKGNESVTPALSLLEFGLYGGGLVPSSEHNFHDERAIHQELGVAPSLGMRVGLFPLSFVGIEGEFGISRASVGDRGSAILGATRAHLVGQLPGWKVTPFALVGVGRWFARSNTLGDDNDPGIHLGIGAKVALDRSFGIRLDLRDNLAQATNSMSTEAAHHPQLLLSISYTALSRKQTRPTNLADVEEQDQDADGIRDADDQCLDSPGRAPHGCPDRDDDDVLGEKDRCPAVAGPAPHGCPDQDGDSVFDEDDQCPEVPGLSSHGCPDQDGDTILGQNDKCPSDAETFNRFEDGDGCPDTKPAAVKRFEGTIDGLLFRTGSAEIAISSRTTLALAAKVLTEYPSIRLRIHGHTDDVGIEEKNNSLSLRRAEAVRAYLVAEFAIEESRLETKGHGSASPVAKGGTKAQRALNRRIEFELLR
jgi:outer membrane protein OmpA-like peptidoglycan-associated protein